MKIFKLLLKILISIGLLFIFGRIFIYDRFLVNTGSMQPTIIPGQVVYVNKLIFGARIYKKFSFNDSGKLSSFRIPGIRDIKHNDIIVCNTPLNDRWDRVTFRINNVYVKRCIGLPGDSLYIKNGFYHIASNSDTLGYIPNQEELSRTPREYLSNNLYVFPEKSRMPRWTILDWGPCYIPQKGDIIDLDINTYTRYKIYIEYETGKQVLIDVNGNIYIDNIMSKKYEFQSNYYFIAGDYVLNSSDSRYFGFVPEEFIIGVVSLISSI